MKHLTGVFAPWGRFYITLVGSLGGGQHNDTPERRKKGAIIAVVVIVLSLGWLWHTMVPSTPKLNRAPFIGLGEVLADETTKAIGNHGTVVPVITSYHTAGSTPMTDEWKTFAKEIKKHSGVKLAEPVIVKLDEAMGEPGVSHAEFDKIVDQHGKANAIVLLVGLPMWDPKNPLTLPNGAPKIIAMNSMPMPVKQYFDRSIITVLITSRMTPETATTGEPKTPRQWFDRYFEIITAQNYQSLPD